MESQEKATNIISETGTPVGILGARKLHLCACEVGTIYHFCNGEASGELR